MKNDGSPISFELPDQKFIEIYTQHFNNNYYYYKVIESMKDKILRNIPREYGWVDRGVKGEKRHGQERPH